MTDLIADKLPAANQGFPDFSVKPSGNSDPLERFRLPASSTSKFSPQDADLMRACTSDDAPRGIAEQLDKSNLDAATKMFEQCSAIRIAALASKNPELKDSMEKLADLPPDATNYTDEQTKGMQKIADATFKERESLLNDVNKYDKKGTGCDLELTDPYVLNATCKTDK